MTTGSLHARHVVILHPRDPGHPDAAGPERYLHRVAARWADRGTQVTWFADRPAGLAERDTLDGIRVVRGRPPRTRVPGRMPGGPLVDAVLTGEETHRPRLGGWPAQTPVLRVVHDPAAVPGRCRRFRGERWIAVSPSVRRALLAAPPAPGPVSVVPPGADDLVGPPGAEDAGGTARRRAERPTVVSWLPRTLDATLLLVWHLATAAAALPALQVEIVGEAPHLPHVRRVAHEHGLADVVTFRGALPAAGLTELLTRAWLVLAAPDDDAWSYPVLEAAATGVPTLAPGTATARDAVVDGVTGWTSTDAGSLGAVLTHALRELAVDVRAEQLAAACRAWARGLCWDRTADLLAGVVAARLTEVTAGRPVAGRRTARPSLSVVATVRPPADAPLRLRVTDEVRPTPDGQVVLLHGCDEADAYSALRRQGTRVASVRLATDLDLVAGPQGPTPSAADPAIPAVALDPPGGLAPWPVPPPPVADGLNGGLLHPA